MGPAGIVWNGPRTTRVAHDRRRSFARSVSRGVGFRRSRDGGRKPAGTRSTPPSAGSKGQAGLHSRPSRPDSGGTSGPSSAATRPAADGPTTCCSGPATPGPSPTPDSRRDEG